MTFKKRFKTKIKSALRKMGMLCKKPNRYQNVLEFLKLFYRMEK